MKCDISIGILISNTETDGLTFIRIMILVGLAIVALAFIIMVAGGSHIVIPPLSMKPLGTSTLSHGGLPVAPPSKALSARPGDGANDQDRAGDMK